MAKRLQLSHLYSGGLYRALTLVALDQKIDLQDARALVKLLRKEPPTLVYSREGTRVVVGERDVTEAIRAPHVTRNVRFIAETADVRRALMPLQRELAKGGAVAEGRDMGTVVFPDAQCKFYLDGSLEVRAQRRYAELKARHEVVSYEQVREEIARRDRQDSSRLVAPLKQAEDAIYVDSSDLTIEQVVDKLYQVCQDRLGRHDSGGI